MSAIVSTGVKPFTERVSVGRALTKPPPAADAILYAKLDSLLRGHVTRGGVQLARTADGWSPAADDLRADLEREGLTLHLRRPGDPVPAGVSLWDA